jgi:Zn-dependent protease
MMRSFTVARVREIDIRLHPTFALVFLWVLIDWRRIGAGVGVSAVVFTLILVIFIFACVLLHEFGHAFMARQHGVRVHDVSLSAIGGVARMEQLPAEPRAEVQIALAGPAANFALVVALAPVVLLIGVASGFSSLEDYASTVFHPSLSGLATTLLYANVLIIVFNLLPAFPMDGGRVFRAGLTSMFGRESGTRVAVLVGEAFAVLLLLFSIFVGGIAPEQPLATALRGGLRDIAVTKDGRVVGMLWRNRLLAELGGAGSGRTVAEAMEQDPITVDANMPIHDVQRLMDEQDRWAVPVLEAGMYRGIFTGDRFLHIYRQLSPDPVRSLRELLDRGPLARLRA